MSYQERMIEAICQEIVLQKTYLDQPIKTVYFGGGTPSILETSSLNNILEAINLHFDLSRVEEVTIESNPDDLTLEKLSSYHELGIDRLSIGIQSFDDKYLTYFNRAHDSRMGSECVHSAKEAGFSNISIDLIFGIPGQTIEELKSDLRLALQQEVPHISIYGLTIEPNTALGRLYEKGKLLPLDEDTAAEQFEIIMTTLRQEGYIQYEISNFALPGFESKHNSSYWQGEQYLGIGPSAHSYNGISRQFNIKNNIKYMDAIESKVMPHEQENLNDIDKINEFILIKLRLKKGLDLGQLTDRFGVELLDEKRDAIDSFIKDGLIAIETNRLVLTRSGILLADHITESLMMEQD